MDLQSISENLSLILIRRSTLPLVETFTKFGTLKEHVILTNDLPGMSLFLLGGELKVEHIKYRQLKKAILEWKGEKIYFIDFKNDFEILKDVIPIYFRFEDINEISFPYYKEGKEAKKLSESLGLNAENKDGKFKFLGSSLVKHVPINLNYWHAELLLMDVQEKPIKDLKRTWSISATEQALGQIISVAFKDSYECTRIPLEYYSKN